MTNTNTNDVFNNAAVYQVRAKQAWTGDDTGREWMLGWSVYPEADSDDGGAFTLYEDDGRGNGGYVGAFATLAAAAVAADRHAAAADNENGLRAFVPVHDTLEPGQIPASPFFPVNDADSREEREIDARIAEAYPPEGPRGYV